MGLISVTGIKRRRNGNYEDPANSRRQATIYFTVPNGQGDIVQVCKKTFLNVYGITKRRIETIVKAKKSGEFTFTEKRGNKKKYRKFSKDDERLIIGHVNSFPKEKSHYSRSKSDKDYLSQDLNISRLFRTFQERYPNSNISYRYYYQTFKRSFPNISFHHSRSDTCGTCDLLHNKIKSEPNNKEAKVKLDVHHRKAEKAREVMKMDHERSQHPTSENSTIAIDLEQVLSLPALTHGEMFYLRQLSCYNLGIHVGDNNKGYMFLWHEGISGRGGNEIASCLFKAITCKIFYKKKLTIWSDNCIAQNKNKMMLFLCIYLVAKGYFEEVEQKYLVSGHSFLSCDRDFAQIEKRKRLEKCEVPMDLVQLMVTATPKNPFMVTLMQPDDFFDFKKAAETSLITTNLQISKAKWILIKKNSLGNIQTRETLNDMEAWKSTKVFKKNISPEIIQNMTLPPLECQSKISKEKKENLKKIIPYVKEENKGFFEDLVRL